MEANCNQVVECVARSHAKERSMKEIPFQDKLQHRSEHRKIASLLRLLKLYISLGNPLWILDNHCSNKQRGGVVASPILGPPWGHHLLDWNIDSIYSDITPQFHISMARYEISNHNLLVTKSEIQKNIYRRHKKKSLPILIDAILCQSRSPSGSGMAIHPWIPLLNPILWGHASCFWMPSLVDLPSRFPQTSSQTF